MWLLDLDAILGVAVLACAALGAGSWIGKLLPESFSQLERFTFSILGGYGIVSLLIFIIGQFAFTRLTILLITIPCFIAGILYARKLAAHIRPLNKTIGGMPAVATIIVATVVMVTAIAGLAEITGDWNNDAVAYHLLGPKVWARAGVIRPVPDNCHTAFPPTAETTYAALLLLSGPRAPGFSSALTFSLLLLTSFSIARRLGLTASEALWAVALIAAMPAIHSGSVGCFIDGLYAAFVLAAFRVGCDAENVGTWRIFGVFCGFAMATKYTGLLAYPALLICLVWLHRKQGWPQVRQFLVISSSVACAIAAPYYVRNAILLGCPIYPPSPGLARICSAKYLPPEMVAQFHDYIRHRGAGMGKDFKAFLLLPFHLTYHTSLFHGAGGIGLAPLSLGPIGAATFWRNNAVKAAALLGCCLTALWFLTQQESRFLIHVYVLGAVFAAMGLRVMWAQRRRLPRALATAVIMLSVGYGAVMIWRASSVGVRAALSPSVADQIHRENVPYAESFAYLNSTPDVKLVLILDRSVPPYYLDKNYIKPVGQWGERALPGSIDSLLALHRAATLKFTHVLDVQSPVGAFQVTDQKENLQLVFESTNQRVYRVTNTEPR